MLVLSCRTIIWISMGNHSLLYTAPRAKGTERDSGTDRSRFKWFLGCDSFFFSLDFPLDLCQNLTASTQRLSVLASGLTRAVDIWLLSRVRITTYWAARSVLCRSSPARNTLSEHLVGDRVATNFDFVGRVTSGSDHLRLLM